MRLLVIGLASFFASDATRSKNDTDGYSLVPQSLFLVLTQLLGQLNGQYPSTTIGALDETSWPEKQADDTQRAIVNRVKRQVREDGCPWCARPANHGASSYSRGATVPHPYDSVPRRAHTAQAPVASFARRTFTVTSAPFMAGGDNGDAFPPSPAYPPLARTSPDGRANGYLRPSIRSSVPDPRAFNAFSGYTPAARLLHTFSTPAARPADPHSSFNHPLPRLSRGGPMRGTGSFAQALGMKSPIPWIRNWQTENRRPRLGFDSRRSR
ncbi:hypothetical protein PRIPAC_97818 [Pristionchus pacificus]|uniref:Uncharacterized protein n=1 Tax=Pristionchus pacificus TaxID=54126 RepID=A0A2A6D1J2_PRIPA|nr:hypothetical protein PRIPAC_97818 [Pristionchus pacificus]|eukprot:PDM84352.1 hypothetical protein PRIPAC_33375 [Pristionchus pacificus]